MNLVEYGETVNVICVDGFEGGGLIRCGDDGQFDTTVSCESIEYIYYIYIQLRFFTTIQFFLHNVYKITMKCLVKKFYVHIDFQILIIVHHL